MTSPATPPTTLPTMTGTEEGTLGEESGAAGGRGFVEFEGVGGLSSGDGGCCMGEYDTAIPLTGLICH